MSQRVATSQAFRNILISSAVAAALGLPIASSFAQGAPQKSAITDIETSAYSFVGEVNADDTLVRSGPGTGENDYQVLKLAKGARLTVVGMKQDWLKIVPPEGSFCLVPQAFIDKSGDDKTGRVINKGAIVRVGSALTTAMYRVAPRKLDPGETVRILGATETGEFYKIAPPRDVFMYVDKRFVIPVQKKEDVRIIGGPPQQKTQVASSTTETLSSAAVNNAAAPSAEPLGNQTQEQTATTVQPKPGDATPLPAGATANDDGKFTVKSDLPQDGAVASAEETAKSIRALQDKLADLDRRYAEAGQQAIATGPLEAFEKEYQTLLADKQLPTNGRKIAELRASQIKLRKEAVIEMAAAKKAEEEAAIKQRNLKAEQEELAAIVKKTEVKHYVAVGELATSSLQAFYRLRDPATGKTIIYIPRTSELAVEGSLQKFVGITGKVVNDANMGITYVQPESLEAADPKLLNTRIYAQFAPSGMATSNLVGEASAR